MIDAMNAHLSRQGPLVERRLTSVLRLARLALTVSVGLACAPVSRAPSPAAGSATSAAQGTPTVASAAGTDSNSTRGSNSPCSSLRRCSDGPCTVGTECYRLASCAEAVCAAHEKACDIDCGGGTCVRLKSSPLQVGCGGAHEGPPSSEARGVMETAP